MFKQFSKRIIFLSIVISFIVSAVVWEEVQASDFRFVSSPHGLNLRSKPGTKSKRILILPFSAKVKVLKSKGKTTFFAERYGKWVNVDYSGKRGWVFSGFLSNFNPEKIRHIAAEFYRSSNQKKWKSQYKKFLKGARKYASIFKFKDNKVKIVSILENFILMEVPDLDWESDGDIRMLNAVWQYDKKKAKCSEFFCQDVGPNGYVSINLLHLNKDRYPDLIVSEAYGCGTNYHLLLGTKNGPVKNEEKSISCDPADMIFYSQIPAKYQDTFGRCGKTRFSCPDYEKRELSLYEFDCSTNSFKKIRDISFKSLNIKD